MRRSGVVVVVRQIGQLRPSPKAFDLIFKVVWGARTPLLKSVVGSEMYDDAAQATAG